MSYVPNTYAQREEMLAEIGKKCIDELFEAIPQDVRIEKLNLPQGKTEFEVLSELLLLFFILSQYSFAVRSLRLFPYS